MDLILAGYGGWGRRVARAAARAFNLVAIIEPSLVRSREARVFWSGWNVQIADSFEDLQVSADACWVATPVSTHAEVVTQMLESGLHVLCEKPFTTKKDVAAKLVALAQKQQLGLMVGHLGLHSQMIEAGFMWLNPNKNRFDVTRRNETGPSLADGDVLWGLGPHDIAALLNLCGEPNEVEATGTQHRTVFTLKWADGSEANVELDWLAMNRERSFSVNGHEIAKYWDAGREPLLTEALAFAELCNDPTGFVAEARLREAVEVTSLLQRIAEAREEIQIEAA